LGTFGIQSNRDVLIELEEDFTEPSVLTLGSFAIKSNKDFLIELEEDFTNTPAIELGSYPIRSNSDFLIEYEEDFTNIPEIELESYSIRSNSDFLIQLEEDITNDAQFTLDSFNVRSYQRPPPTFIGASPAVASNTPTVSVPAGVTAGDFLILVTASWSVFGGDRIPNVPSGWTLAKFESQGQYLTILFKTATANESAVTLNFTVGDASLQSRAVMLAYRSTAGFDPQPNPAYTYGNYANETKPNIAITDFANEVVITFYAYQSSGDTLTPPSGTNVRVNASVIYTTSSAPGILIIDELQAIAGQSTPRVATKGQFAGDFPWTSFAIPLYPAIV
jgi:hypothetical protein